MEVFVPAVGGGADSVSTDARIENDLSGTAVVKCTK